MYMKKLQYILYALVIVAAGGLLAYQGLVEHSLTTSSILKCVLVIAGAIVGMLRPTKRRTPTNHKAAYEKAYGNFIRGAFQDDPKLEKQLYRAIAFYNQDKPASGIAVLNKLRKQCQRTADLYAVTVFTALCYDDMQQWEDAAAQYDAASKMRNDSTLHSNMGLCLQKLGRFDEAEEAYTRALQVDPKNAVALNNLSALYFRQDDYEGALDYAEEALQINAKMPQALTTAAVCCAIQGYEKEYESYFRRAVAAGCNGAKIKETINKLDPNL